MSAAEFMRRNHGIITRREARSSGLTNHQIDSLIRRGEWVPVHRGVFRHAAVAPSWRGRVAAACLAGQAVASHRCAAALWGLELVRRPAPEITVPVRRRAPMLRGVRVHRTTQWSDVDRTMRHGIEATGIRRTILDCAVDLGPYSLERLAESAIRQELTSWDGLVSVLNEQGARGRPGSAGLRALLDRRSADPIVPRSDFSRRVAQMLERDGLPPPRIEFAVHDDDGTFLLLADLAWPVRRCIIELDGLEHHFAREDRELDLRKRARVRAAGWRVLELTWRQVDARPDESVRFARDFLGGS